MKSNAHLFNIVTLALVVLAVYSWRPQVTTAARQPAVADDECNSSRSIQVSGSAVVYVTPDQALLQLGVQSNGTTPEATHHANELLIESVTQALRGLGVEPKDIASDYYLVYPIYDDYDALVISGYRVDNTVSITVRDISLVDDILVAALESGANEVQDVQFYTSELRKYRDQARELAVTAAGEKAQALAGAAGSVIGCVLNISENSWTQYYGSWRGGRQLAIWAQNAVQNAGGGLGVAEDSPISLGQIAIRADVNASYSLR